MESLGNKLKEARESKGYTYDYVSRETNISSRYLDALEQEDFSRFPGEPYILGFLKTYGAFLDLNTAELLSLYRSQKLQEQPVPMEQLLRGSSNAPKIVGIIFAVFFLLGLGAAGAWYFLIKLPNRSSIEVPVARVPVEYTLSADSLERRFYLGDTILVSLEDNIYKMELTGLGDAVSITTPLGVKTLDLGQDTVLDLTDSGLPELRIILADFDKIDTNAGALLRFELETFSGTVAASEAESAEIITGATGLQGATVIFSSPSAYPFTLQAAFQGYCLFRWEVLAERGRTGRNEQYFQRSNEHSIQAQNGIRIGVSNAQAVKFQIIGGGRTVPLELGGAGEIVVADIRWVRDEDNRFRLLVIRLE